MRFCIPLDIVLPNALVMPIAVNTNSYKNSHGINPKGFGRWLFEVGDKSYTFTGIYTDAKKAAARYAKSLGVTSIKVLP